MQEEGMKTDEWRVEKGLSVTGAIYHALLYRNKRFMAVFEGSANTCNQKEAIEHVAHNLNMIERVRGIANSIHKQAKENLCKYFGHSVMCSMLNEHQSYDCDKDCIYRKWEALLTELEKPCQEK